MHRAIILPLMLLAACKPPAADDYVERARIDRSSEGPSEPIDSPDTTDAVWAPSSEPRRLLYGIPGERPFFAIECVVERPEPAIAYTRFARADPHAKAMLALIGNSHVSRFPIDAARIGDIWRWDGEMPALDPRWDVLTGTREVEATVPGAGSVILNSSPLPGTLVEDCRALAAPPPSEEPEDAEPSAPSPPEDPA